MHHFFGQLGGPQLAVGGRIKLVLVPLVNLRKGRLTAAAAQSLHQGRIVIAG